MSLYVDRFDGFIGLLPRFEVGVKLANLGLVFVKLGSVVGEVAEAGGVSKGGKAGEDKHEVCCCVSHYF